MSVYLLSLITFLPLAGAAVIAMAKGDPEVVAKNARYAALWTSSVTLLLAIFMWIQFDSNAVGFQFVEDVAWLSGTIRYQMGVDGISAPFVLLTASLMPLCVLASWQAIQKRVKEYMVAFLVLETLLIGVFCAQDLVVFYLFFEGGLIPMFFIIGIWGGARRIYATFKFFLYTFLGSVLMLVAIIAIYWVAGTTSIPDLLRFDFPPQMQPWLWLAFFAAFMVKLPMWPAHTWLPDAHVEAPTAGSVILAGVLLKLGGYGFLRFSLPMFPLASEMFTVPVFVLSIIAILYTSLVALAQKDIKKLIAYSSVAHMGYVTIGIFCANAQGIQGAVFQMLSHGWISAALFLCVGVLYDRTHSREIATYGGIVQRMPVFAFALMVFSLANVGLPGTSGFIGEILPIVGAFEQYSWVAALAATGMILSAAYMLFLYRRVIFGTVSNEALKDIMDVTPREIAILLPLLAATILFGIYPAPVLDAVAVTADQILIRYQEGLALGGATPY
ncbi:MAG: NADH-quinone oxidoreductase subunit M [Hyphomicrobiales bacterium]|nr:NADH-quinone oxidoreductase subunit M [Hyphomicrobiales bacterium]